MMSKRGVYFVANDAVYELAVAFLTSFRIHNPSLPLCLIPYDDDVRQLLTLAGTYDFTCFSAPGLLARCDEIGRPIHGRVFGHYRKLAAWHGSFDEFIYIDTDTVVTSDVTFVFEFLKAHAFVFSHSNLPELTQWVWKKTIYAAGALTSAQIEFSANTGFICSSKGKLTIGDAEQRLTSALQIAEHMELYCIEQPFLNYLVVTSGKSYSSIASIAAQTGARHLPIEKWGGERLQLLSLEHCRTVEHNVLMVHWSGKWQPRPLEKWAYNFVRRLGYKGALPTISLFMRNRRLWLYYRRRSEHLFVGRRLDLES